MVVLLLRCVWDLILTGMMHLFRPADSPDSRTPPVWKTWRGLLYVILNHWLAPVAKVARSQQLRALLGPLLLLVGLAAQVVLLGLAGYLVDLSISLMELWTELARKHMELTL
jgi:hypothetical protein